MLKKLICMILAVLMLSSLQLTAFATDKKSPAHLEFDENGDFTILHLTDWHCDYPLPDVHRQLVLESIAEARPDLVVLGGDLSEAPHENQPAAIKEICDIFCQRKNPVCYHLRQS